MYIKPYGERRSELLGMFTGYMIRKSVVCAFSLTILFTALSHIIIVIIMLFIESMYPLLLLQEEPEGVMVDYVIPPHHPHHQPHQQLLLEPGGSMSIGASVDRGLSFADVMQFADFVPKLALHHPHDEHHEHQGHDASIENFNRDGDPNSAVDAINFLKFPVLNNQLIMSGGPAGNGSHNHGESVAQFIYEQQENRNANIYNNPVQLEFMGNAAGNSTDENIVKTTGEKIGQASLEGGAAAGKNASTTKRKRPRTIKTSEEVESQRMTHIAVERNRRKQMNEHLRVLRSLMPSSYVQRVSTCISS